MTLTIRHSTPMWAIGLLVAFAAARADAISISMDPAASVMAVGDSVAISLEVSGLVDGAAPSLAVYDIDVVWDASAVQLSTVALGDPLLGNQLDLSGFGTLSSIAFAPGTLSIFEQSLDSIATANSLQAGSFTIATLTFTLLDPAGSAITPSIVVFGDPSGLPLPVESLTGAVLSAAPIPEPSAAVLSVVGLLLVRNRIRHAGR